jgi:hypothetical protein
MTLSVTCFYCGKSVDPTARETYRRVVGWERKAFMASRKSGSDIVLREARDEYAHPSCIALERDGIVVGQGSLL